MSDEILNKDVLTKTIKPTIFLTMFLAMCLVIVPDYSEGSGYNISNPVTPPVVGQAPTTSSGVRANWLGYFAPPAWMQRRGSGSDRREQQRGVISPGIGQ
jgi:hypothetical protein